jgi:hypothetical protein
MSDLTFRQPRARWSIVSCILSQWSGWYWAFMHAVGYHGLGDPFYEFGMSMSGSGT